MKTLINIKADKYVKEEAQALASELGLSLSAVMNAFLKEFLRSRSIAFSAIPKMTPALEELLATVEDDLRLGKNLSPKLSSLKDIEAYLRLK